MYTLPTMTNTLPKQDTKLTLQESMEQRLAQVEREKEALTHQVQDLTQNNNRLEFEKEALVKENASLRDEIRRCGGKRQQNRGRHHRRRNAMTNSAACNDFKPRGKNDSEQKDAKLPSLVPEEMAISMNPSYTDFSYASDHQPPYNAMVPSAFLTPFSQPPPDAMPFTNHMVLYSHHSGMSSSVPLFHPTMYSPGFAGYDETQYFQGVPEGFMGHAPVQRVGTEEGWFEDSSYSFEQYDHFGDSHYGEGEGGAHEQAVPK